MRKFLIGLFMFLLLFLAAVTIAASLERSVLEAGRGLWPDPWFRATLADAYIGFVIFYVWVAYKDTKAEEEAITMYKSIIEMAHKEGDVTTAFIFKEILEDEEEHHDLFTTMLEEV